MLPLKMLAGAVIGGALGVLMGRARICGSERCNVKVNVIASAVAGAAVAFYLSRP